jgi:hypothetical protein
MTNGESSSIPADFGRAFTDSNGNILRGKTAVETARLL